MRKPDPLKHDLLAVPYRGRDRRSIISPNQASIGRPYFIAGFGLVALTAIVFALGLPKGASGELESIAASFELSAGALGIVAATLCVVRWRLAGDARALWLGTAVGIYSVFSIALAQVLPPLLPDEAFVEWMRPASLVVSLAIFGYALRAPEVDARLQPVKTFGVALAGFAVTSLVLVLVPSVRTLLVDASVEMQSAVAGVIAIAWAGFATVYFLRGMRGGRLLIAWYGLTMFGLTLAELTRALQQTAPDDLLVGSAIIRCIALLYAVVGVMRELQSMFASQSSRLLQTTVDTLSSNASLRAAQQRQEELAHEARNALTAIEGATQTLERFRENLDDDTRRALAIAVSDEIGRLQRLVGASTSTNHPVSFRLADIIGPQLDLARAQGAHPTAEVASDLVAYGRPADFAEVLQNLLVNARVHGRNPITVRAVPGNDHIFVRVEDRGPGVPVELRKAIFERGRRASDAPGSGLGLYLSRQLIKAQNGNLWVEQAAGGGAAFIMAIPAGPLGLSSSFTDSGRLTPIKQSGNGGKPANGHRPVAGDGAEHAQARARARIRKHEKPIN